MHRFKLQRCIRLPGPIGDRLAVKRCESKHNHCQAELPVLPPLTTQHVADYLHGQRLHSWECGLTTDHNGEASVSPSHGS